jgi:hypothetical protein
VSKQFLTPIRPPVVASFPSSPSKGDTVVLNSDGHLYTYSGAAWVDNGAAGASGGLSNLDGGTPSSVYGGVTAIDGGTP